MEQKYWKSFFGNLWYGADALSSFREGYDVAGTDVMRTSPVIRLYVWLAGLALGLFVIS